MAINYGCILTDSNGYPLLDDSGQVLTAGDCYDDRCDGVDRTTGCYIFPGADHNERELNVSGMLNGITPIQTWIQLQTLGIFIGGSLPAYYEPGAMR